MSLATTGGVPAIPDDDDLTGLEDIDDSDLVMPTIRLTKEGKFKDGLTGEEFDSLDVIVLGLIKGRILWPAEVSGDKEPPLCRSRDFHNGEPGEKFPWKAAGLNPNDYGDNPLLACGSCPLKEWGSHPTRDVPWCSEQHTYALLVGESRYPALITFQRSGIKPSRAYLTGFKRSKTPMFTVETRLSASVNRRGSVDYAVPEFSKIGQTAQEDWPEFRSQFRMIRDFVQRIDLDEEGNVVKAEPTSTVETSATEVKVSSPAPASPASPAPADDDDDLPF